MALSMKILDETKPDCLLKVLTVNQFIVIFIYIKMPRGKKYIYISTIRKEGFIPWLATSAIHSQILSCITTKLASHKMREETYSRKKLNQLLHPHLNQEQNHSYIPSTANVVYIVIGVIQIRCLLRFQLLQCLKIKGRDKMITRKIWETIPELLWQNIITVFCVLWWGGGKSFPCNWKWI